MIETARVRRNEWMRIRWSDALIVFLVALAVRSCYLVEASHDPSFDLLYMDEEYHVRWAHCVRSGHWEGPYERLRDGPYFRAPLYPHLLAGLFSVLGSGLLAPRIVQIVMGSCSCGLVCILGTLACSRTVGVVAGLTCAVSWVLVYFDAEFLLPVLLVFLLSVGFVCTLLAVRRGSIALMAASGTAMGLYAITRPNILAFLPFYLAWIWWAVGRDSRRKSWALVGVAAAGFLFPAAAVTVRNGLVGGDWVVVASQGGVNFYIGNNERSNGMEAVVPGTRHTWWGGYDDARDIAERDTGSRLTPSQVSAFWFRRGVASIRNDPAAWVRLTLRKAAAFIGDVEIPNNEPYEARRHRYDVLRFSPVGFGVLLSASVIGFPLVWREARRRGREGEHLRQAMALFLLFVVSYGASIVAFFVTGRYRVPLIPVLALGAALTVGAILGFLRTGRIAHAVVVVAAIAVATYGLSRDYLGVRASTEDFAIFADAQDALSLGHVDRAIELLEEVERHGRFDVSALYTTLTHAYIARNEPGDGDRILATSLRGLVHHPDEPELLWYAAIGHAAHHQWAHAESVVSRFLTHRPNDVRALLLAYRVAVVQGDSSLAARLKAHAYSLDPSHPAIRAMEAVSSVPPSPAALRED